MTITLKLEGEVWHANGTIIRADGKKIRVRQSTGFKKNQKQWASAQLSAIIHEAIMSTDETDNYCTVDEAINLFLERPNPPGETDRQNLKKFSKTFGSKTLHELKTREVLTYLNSFNNVAGTVAREMNSINAMIVHAKESGVSVPDLKLKRPNVDDARTRWLTEKERDLLIAKSEKEIKGLLTFLFYTGCTIGEAFALTWQNARNGNALFTRRKGRGSKSRTRAVPLSPEAKRGMGKDNGGYVFTMPDGRQWDRDSFYPYFYTACGRAKIEDFKPHDTRHTFASHLVQRGASLRAVADLLGHTSLTMVMRYSHLSHDHLGATIGLLRKRGKFLTSETDTSSVRTSEVPKKYGAAVGIRTPGLSLTKGDKRKSRKNNDV
tara:strand:- start:5194 stop:6327 length:1134 start_codon:yes stop_codon:yes gene_type:complete